VEGAGIDRLEAQAARSGPGERGGRGDQPQPGEAAIARPRSGRDEADRGEGRRDDRGLGCATRRERKQRGGREPGRGAAKEREAPGEKRAYG